MKTKLSALFILACLTARALPIGIEQSYQIDYLNSDGEWAVSGFYGTDSGGTITARGSSFFGFDFHTAGGDLSYYTDNGHGQVTYNGAFEITAFSFSGFSHGSGGNEYAFAFDLGSAHATWWQEHVEMLAVSMTGDLTITGPGIELHAPGVITENVVTVPDTVSAGWLLAFGLGVLVAIRKRLS